MSSSASDTIHTPIYGNVWETSLFHPCDMAEVSKSSDVYFLDDVSSSDETRLIYFLSVLYFSMFHLHR